jgi:hypothetical protein
VQLLHNFFTRLNMVRKGEFKLAWHGAGGGHVGAGVQMSTVTLQVARAMPAWSVNWCACSKPLAFDFLNLCVNVHAQI